jgi:ribonuclease D
MAQGNHDILVDTSAGLQELIDHLRAAGRFGFDTEFVSENTFEPVLCLVQVASADRLALVDTLTVPDVDPLWQLIHDPGVEVVMHAASEDLRICMFETGQLPRRVFDVQIAAGLLGYGYPLSLVNLVSRTLRVSLAGGETRTDWRRRPLSAGQLRYALDDVRHLLELASRLKSELQERARWDWAESEFEALVAEIRGRDADQDRWRRLPGLNQLNRRGLEAVRRLAAWRENNARSHNRPLRSVLRDDLLVAIAKRQPANRRDLEALRDFNRPALLNQSEAILAVLEQARAVPADGLPEHPFRPDESPGTSTLVNLLSAALGQHCAQHGVAGSLVANVTDLRHVIRWFLSGRQEQDHPDVLKGWRGELCGHLLLEVLEGRRTFRVIDPASEYPISLEPA